MWHMALKEQKREKGGKEERKLPEILRQKDSVCKKEKQGVNVLKPWKQVYIIQEETVQLSGFRKQGGANSRCL